MQARRIRSRVCASATPAGKTAIAACPVSGRPQGVRREQFARACAHWSRAFPCPVFAVLQVRVWTTVCHRSGSFSQLLVVCCSSSVRIGPARSTAARVTQIAARPDSRKCNVRHDANRGEHRAQLCTLLLLRHTLQRIGLLNRTSSCLLCVCVLCCS